MADAATIRDFINTNGLRLTSECGTVPVRVTWHGEEISESHFMQFCGVNCLDAREVTTELRQLANDRFDWGKIGSVWTV